MNNKNSPVLFATILTLLLISTIGIWSVQFWHYLPEWTGFKDKTIWSLLELLIVPIFLAIGAATYSQSQHSTEVEIESERQKESAFQSYVDRIKNLVVELQTLDVDVESLGNIGAAYTRATLQQIDIKRKRMLLEFLYDSQLIGWTRRLSEEKLTQLIFLGESADFSGLVVDYRTSSGIRLALCGINLAQVNLSNSKLIGVDFHKAYLSSCNMSNSSFTFVDFSGADMSGINLSNTKWGELISLDGAELRFANLKNADLRKANLNEVNSIFKARYNHKTKFPQGFDPVKKDMTFEK